MDIKESILQIKKTFHEAKASLCQANMRLSNFAVRRKEFIVPTVSLALLCDAVSFLSIFSKDPLSQSMGAFMGGALLFIGLAPAISLDMSNIAHGLPLSPATPETNTPSCNPKCTQ